MGSLLWRDGAWAIRKQAVLTDSIPVLEEGDLGLGLAGLA